MSNVDPDVYAAARVRDRDLAIKLAVKRVLADVPAVKDADGETMVAAVVAAQVKAALRALGIDVEK